MYISIEFIAQSIIGVTQGDYFKTQLLVEDQVCALGSDDFDLNCVVLKDYLVAASGRNANYGLSNLAAGLGTLQILQSEPQYVNSKGNMLLSIKTNLFKEPALLLEKLGVRIIVDGVASPITPLNSPIFNVQEIKDQELTIDITELFSNTAKMVG